MLLRSSPLLDTSRRVVVAAPVGLLEQQLERASREREAVRGTRRLRRHGRPVGHRRCHGERWRGNDLCFAADVQVELRGPAGGRTKAPAGRTWVALKDFSDVVYNNEHVVYMSTDNGSGSYGSAMMTFTDWPEAATATQIALPQGPSRRRSSTSRPRTSGCSPTSGGRRPSAT